MKLKPLQKWLRYLCRTDLGGWLRDLCPSNLAEWFRFMREENPPAITEDYGAVVVYDYIDRKEGVVKDLRDGAVSIPRNIRVDSVVIERTFNLDTISTFVFPFDSDVKDIIGLEIYTPVSVDISGSSGTYTLEPVTGRIHAYEPYVVKGLTSTIQVKGPVTFKKTHRNDKPLGDSYMFMAALEYTKFTGTEGAFGIAASGSSYGSLVKAGKGAWVSPLRAYILTTGA